MPADDLRRLVDSVADGVIVADTGGSVLFANRAALAMFPAGTLLAGRRLPWEGSPGDAGPVAVTDPGGPTSTVERSATRLRWGGADAWLIELRRPAAFDPADRHGRRVNQLYVALSQTSSAVARANDEMEVFEDVCRIAVAFAGFRLAWVGRPSRDGREVERVAAAGPEVGFLQGLRIALDPATEEGQGPIGRTLRLGVPYICNDIAADPLAAPWRAAAARHHLASFAVCPVRCGGAVTAFFAVGSHEPGYFGSDLLNLLNQMSGEISFGLDRQMAREGQAAAERALAESELRFRQMAAASSQVFWMRDAETDELLYLSPAFSRIFGRSPEEFLGTRDRWLDLVHPDDREAEREQARRPLAERVGVRSFRIVRPDATVRWVEDDVRPIRDETRIIRLAGSLVDITERHQAEEQTRLFRGLVEYSSDAFYVIDPRDEFRLLFINDAGVRHFGWSREQLLRMRVWDWSPTFTRESMTAFWETVKAQQSATIETEHRRADGTGVKVEVTANLLRHAGAEYLAGFFRDITARAAAEEALRESESRFRILFDESADGLIIAGSADAQILDCNPLVLALFDARGKKQLVGRAWSELPVLDHSAADVRALAAEVERHGRAAREIEYASLHGRRFWAAVAVQRLAHGGRRLDLIRLTDVTDRRRVLELLADVQKIARVGGWEYRVGENRLVWTDEVYRIHEVPAGTPLELEQALAFVAPESRGAMEAAMREALATGRPWQLEIKVITSSGRPIWIKTDGRAEVSDGKPWRLFGMIQDITQEKEAAAALREREDKLQEQAMLLDAANDAIVLRSLDHTIEYWNRGAARLLGWSRAEAVGRKATELYVRNPKVLEEVTQRVLEHGAWNDEIELVTKKRERVLVEARWTLIRDGEGRPRAILAINTDITEKKRIEARFLRAQRLESIGTLAGGIAHDLNNILAPIILSADMLRTSVTDESDLELVDTIALSGRRGAEVVRQVLSFARGIESTRVPLNIRHLLSEFRKIARETFPRNITVETDAPTDLWTVQADPMQLNQVLLNLGLNARDAMPDGGLLRVEATNIQIDATFAGLVPDAKPGPHVRVCMTDAGCGIREDIRHRIFDPFFTTKGVGQGGGLGLSTALAIVRSHGGFMTVESEVGRGSTFAFCLPALDAMPSAQAGPAEIAEVRRGAGETILVIDDEETVRSIIRQSLEGAGYRVVMAADGAEGITAFVRHQQEIALVLTDLMMPIMDGSAAIAALHRMNPAVRVVAMSGVADMRNVAEVATPDRPLQFLLKPFSLDSLLRAVSEALAPAQPPENPT